MNKSELKMGPSGAYSLIKESNLRNIFKGFAFAESIGFISLIIYRAANKSAR